MTERVGNQYGRACNRGASLILAKLDLLSPEQKANLEAVLGRSLDGPAGGAPTTGLPGTIRPVEAPTISPSH